MATIQRGILSGFSGAIGSVTGAKSKGIDTMRSRVTKPKNPQTPKQVLSRFIFSELQKPFTQFVYGNLPDNYLNLEDYQTQKLFRRNLLKSMQNLDSYIFQENILKPKYNGDILNVIFDDPDNPWNGGEIMGPAISNAVSSKDSDIFIILSINTSIGLLGVDGWNGDRGSGYSFFVDAKNMNPFAGLRLDICFFASADLSYIFNQTIINPMLRP